MQPIYCRSGHLFIPYGPSTDVKGHMVHSVRKNEISSRTVCSNLFAAMLVCLNYRLLKSRMCRGLKFTKIQGILSKFLSLLFNRSRSFVTLSLLLIPYLFTAVFRVCFSRLQTKLPNAPADSALPLPGDRDKSSILVISFLNEINIFAEACDLTILTFLHKFSMYLDSVSTLIYYIVASIVLVDLL